MTVASLPETRLTVSASLLGTLKRTDAASPIEKLCQVMFALALDWLTSSDCGLGWAKEAWPEVTVGLSGRVLGATGMLACKVLIERMPASINQPKPRGRAGFRRK